MDLYPVREWQEKNINVGVGGWDGGAPTLQPSYKNFDKAIML